MVSFDLLLAAVPSLVLLGEGFCEDVCSLVECSFFQKIKLIGQTIISAPQQSVMLKF